MSARLNGMGHPAVHLVDLDAVLPPGIPDLMKASASLWDVMRFDGQNWNRPRR